eukprot:CAMPEP_0201579584 /NCGR_PEP_ID=MMETSP0190_2-20130828/27289_1 /ASSEMBLY_ACC=CAM_ASM_000263 /TAXON_ID=37353 /ORGANISM="Rosalina sp." /LENGTH=71 /DNA_ID=CAMNT_0048014255 /DNA_START=155 /DNA_END=370 /DNA_ORIENTATION=-
MGDTGEPTEGFLGGGGGNLESVGLPFSDGDNSCSSFSSSLDTHGGGGGFFADDELVLILLTLLYPFAFDAR